MKEKLKTYLNKIKTFFVNLFKKFSFKDWLLLILGILLIIMFFWVNSLKSENLNLSQSYTDSVTVYKNKAGEEYKEKQLAILSVDELKKENSELYQEIKSLKETPVVVSKVETVFKVDTVKLETTHTIIETDSIPDHQYNWSFNHPDNYYALSGKSLISGDFNTFSSTLDNLTVNSKITLDVIDNDENLSVIVKSDNPYVDISDINSVVIDPTKSKTLKKYFPQKKWGLGPSVGVGVDKNLHFTPYIGVSINYSIISF
jgi:uncharacterized small protein (DUF1192 family)